MSGKDNIIVIGAGPVGLAAAIRLARQGHQVTVYEGRDEIPLNNDNSYPIGVNPRGQKTLRAINPKLVDELDRVGMRVDAWDIVANGRRVAHLKSGVCIGTTRADVNAILYEESLKDANISIAFGHKLHALDLAQKQLTFELSNGEHKVVDGSQNTRVLAGDGIWSKCRREFEAQAGLKVQQGKWGVHFRVIFSKAGASTPELNPAVHYIFDQVYTATVKDGIWVASLTVQESDAGSEEYNMLMSNDPSDANVAALRAYLSKRAPLVLKIVDDDDLRKYFTRSTFTGAVTRCDRVNYGEWLLLLGDAAHSVIPPTGEGVNSGLEDTRILAELFESNEDHSTVFEQFNTVRMPDLKALGDYAWDAMENIRTEDKARRVANVLVRIGQTMWPGSYSVEEDLFGEKSVGCYAYREILGKWKKQNDAWFPKAYKVAGWFTKSGNSVPAA